MELYERMRKHGVGGVRIEMDEWEKHYANTYNIIGLNNSEQEKINAAEDIIAIYLLREQEEALDAD